MASPSTVITLGFGNGTLTGSPSLVLTLGFGVGEVEVPEPPSTPGLEYTMPRNRLHATMPRGRLHATVKD